MRWIVAILLFALALPAQRGDHPGEAQPPLPVALQLPPPEVLSPAEALAALRVEAGLVVELFAAEPLVVAPVAMRFDAMGRLWVVEMRGFMPDIDGTDEGRATGCIAVLEDTDGDGRADKRTDFADGLVLPRALALVRGGVLVLEPPWLRFFADSDGDLEPESERILLGSFGGRHSPEHAPNGLVPGLDNWLHWANHPQRMRWDGERLQVEASLAQGQWGLAQDDLGRFFFNSNSDQLRAALVPSHLMAANPASAGAGLADVRVAADQRVFPIRATPGVNRGYQQGFLKEGRLAHFTGACSPFILRSLALGTACQGSAFVCEPCAHLVRRNVLTESPRGVEATIANQNEEFLASTDERFRPVALAEGLDGALYIADMARGVIQHKLFVTTFLRQQVAARKLEEPIDRGRIFRVRHAATPRAAAPRPAGMNNRELVALLSHPAGAVRDTAQRLLVEREAREAAPELRAVVRQQKQLHARLHALRTLEALAVLDEQTLLSALRDAASDLRAEALLVLPSRAADMQMESLRLALTAAIADPIQRVQQHAALVLGRIPEPVGKPLLLELLAHGSATLQTLALTGCAEKEADLALALAERGGGSGLGLLLRHALARRQQAGLFRLFAFGCAPAQQQERAFVLAALRESLKSAKPRRALVFAKMPAAEVCASILGEPAFADHFTWPGRSGGPALPPGLDAEGRALNARGALLFQQHCVACHQADGRGMEGVAPSLASSLRVPRAPDVLARILLDGFTSLNSGRGEFGTEMPRFTQLANEDLAALATHVRRSFGHEEGAVLPGLVDELRRKYATRGRPWTATELEDSSR